MSTASQQSSGVVIGLRALEHHQWRTSGIAATIAAGLASGVTWFVSHH